MELHILSYVLGPFLGRNPLWFDSCKRSPSINDHSVFAFSLVANGRFEFRSNRYDQKPIRGWIQPLMSFWYDSGRRKRPKQNQLSILGVVIWLSLIFRGKSSAAKFLGTRTHCCAMEDMIIENEEKMLTFVGKTCCKWTILSLKAVEILRSSFCGIFGQIHSPV